MVVKSRESKENDVMCAERGKSDIEDWIEVGKDTKAVRR